MALAYRRDRATAEPHVPATEARVHFGELIQAVEETGEAVLVERNGRPIVAVVQIGEYRRLQRKVKNDDLLASLEATRIAFREAFRGSMEPLNAAALIREGRDDYEDWLAWETEEPGS